MAMAERLSNSLRNIVICIFIFFYYEGILFSANLHTADSLNISSEIVPKINQNEAIYINKEPSGNFYKTDNIFSFNSQKGFFPSLTSDFGEQAVAPFKFKTQQWLITGGAAGITAVLFHFDNDIDKWARVQKQKHEWVGKSSPVITQLGGKWGVYSVLATGLLSAGCGNEKCLQTSLLATQAIITSGVWVNMIKILTGRERPMADYTFSKDPGGEWYGPFARYDNDSPIKKPITEYDAFPSGHTATAFSIATVFATQYKDIKAIPIICYSTATLIGISRLTEHEHWSSDVFVGGILGYVCGKQVVNHYNNTHSDLLGNSQLKSSSKTEFSFIKNGNQIGFLLKW